MSYDHLTDEYLAERSALARAKRERSGDNCSDGMRGSPECETCHPETAKAALDLSGQGNNSRGEG